MDTERLVSLIRPEVKSLAGYVAGKAPSGSYKRRIKLASNENLVINNSDVQRHIKRILSSPSLEYYPDSHQTRLREAVISFLEREGFSISPEQIVFGDGSGESLQMVMMAFVNPGDTVVIPEQSFSLYRTRAILAGARVVEVRRKNLWVDLDALKETAIQTRAKLVVFSNPDNPTSTTHGGDDLERFLRGIPPDVLVLLDEAYIHFANWRESGLHFVTRYPNLIIMHTLSKAFGLAALRVGFTVSHPILAEQMEKIRLPFNLGLLAQEGAWYRLTHPNRIWESVEIICRERKALIDFLEKEGRHPLPAGGNFVFCDFGPEYKRIVEYLENHGITVRSLGSFGYDPRFVRITVGGPRDMTYFKKIFLLAVREAGLP
ncbi:pyridoxal phosphate-dependent aminotransferase [Thermospira aquatica]|uniref:Histidinol-phosphate aminotransferase n=1 Tax=Thermospira aquatica TaxID=2828656 RepID=A0AAX3BFI5_9SPIR|nr:histidinol-phosphate transaminase [Thermospira aquatica]URA11157.1 histidinol-phosphate aminotransferase family protein [Thermospira aquatica]